MSEAYRYQLVLLGVADPNTPVDDVATGFGGLIRQDLDTARKLLNGGRRVLKRDLSLTKARDLAARVSATGARCAVELTLDAALFHRSLTTPTAPPRQRLAWRVSKVDLVPGVLAAPKTLDCTNRAGRIACRVENARVMLGRLLQLPAALAAALMALKAVTSGALGVGLFSSMATVLGLIAFAVGGYGTYMLLHIPRLLHVRDGKDEVLVSLHEQGRPWRGTRTYALSFAHADDAHVMLERRQNGAVSIDGLPGLGLLNIAEPSPDATDEGSLAARDWTEELLDLGAIGGIRDWLFGWFGGDKHHLVITTEDGRTLGRINAGRQLHLQLDADAREQAPALLLAALVAVGV